MRGSASQLARFGRRFKEGPGSVGFRFGAKAGLRGGFTNRFVPGESRVADKLKRILDGRRRCADFKVASVNHDGGKLVHRIESWNADPPGFPVVRLELQTMPGRGADWYVKKTPGGARS